MLGKNNWYRDEDKTFAEAQVMGKPVFLYFCHDACIACKDIEMMIHQDQDLADLIQNHFIGLRITQDMTVMFQRYKIDLVPTFIVAGPDGTEYERFADLIGHDDLAALCLFALGKYCHDRNDTDAAQQHMEKLVDTYPHSPYAPEAIFLRGAYRYLISEDPAHLKTALFMLGKNHPGSIWVRRSLVLHLHHSSVADWDNYRKQHRDYWKSKEAYLKAYFTYHNGPSIHHLETV